MDTAHDSSPRSRELDPDATTTTTTTIFDEPPPPTTITTTHNKVKFLCSYGGRIQPRPHDNHLTYVGGDTKILAVERNIKFSSIMSKLSALTNTTDICFKYQLPGEDLDALISVTNDEDLHHMMVEYDRLCRASPRPARLRLILFSLNSHKNNNGNNNNNNNANNNNDVISPMNNFVDALNSVPPPPPSAPGNPDFLFGLDKPYPAVSVTVPDFAAKDAEGGTEDRRSVEENEVQRQIQELQKLQPGNNELLLQRKIEGECTCYTQKNLPEKGIPVCSGPVPVPGPVTFLPVSGTEPGPVYLIQTPTGIYQAVRAVTGPVGPSPVYLIPAPTSLPHSHSGNKISYGGSEVGVMAERGYAHGVGRQDAAVHGGEGWN